MAIQWHYQTGAGQQSGPVDSRELRRLAEAGIVRPDTLVRKGASRRWVRAEDVRGLFQRSTPAPSPSLGASPPGPPPLPPPVACLSTSQVKQEAELARRSRADRDREPKPTGLPPVQESASVSGVQSGTLTEFGRYVLATVACGAILLLYVIACGVFEWRRGGGAIPMLMFLGAMAATWKAITGDRRRRNEQIPESPSPHAPQVQPPPEPVRPAPAVVSGPATKNAAEATPNEGRPPLSQGARVPVPHCSAPSTPDTGQSSACSVVHTTVAGDAREKPERIWPVTWAAIIVGSGTALLLLWALVFRGGSAPQQQAEAESKSVPATGNVKILELADLAELVGPSVVQVNVTGPEGGATGSGFVLDKQGTIVTNYHVIEDATAGRIVFSDRTSAPITGYLGVWPEKDIALVRVECPPEKLHPLRLATSAPRQGERVAAFGSPLGLQQSVSEGIVSAVRESKELRALGPIDVNARLIQTTTPISHGNSGGPLVDMKGMVVGVNTWTFRHLGGENVNFAVAAMELPPLLLAKNETPSPLPASDPAANGVRRILRRASDHMDAGDYDSAIADYTEAIRLDPTRADAYFWRGEVYRGKDDFDSAIADYTQAIRLDPKDAVAYFERGIAYCVKGDYDSAIADYTEAIRLDPKDARAYYGRGLAYQVKGQRAAAERDFAKAKELGYKP